MAFNLSSCQKTKDDYIKDFASFVEKVQVEYKDYDESDWKKANETFESFAVEKLEKYRSELSPEEMNELNELRTTFVALQIRKGATDFGKKLEDTAKSGEKAMEKLLQEEKGNK